MNSQSGTIYVEVYMEAYGRSRNDVRRFEAMQWKCRIMNALRCYTGAKTQEAKREVVRFYAEEFKRLGWSIPK